MTNTPHGASRTTDPDARRAVVAALVACASVAALAKPLPSPTTRQRPGRFRLGPLYVTPRLELKNAGVDTNVFNSQTGAVSDTSVVLSPGVLGVLDAGSRLRLTGEGRLDINYFRRQGSERSTDFSGQGRAELLFGPLTFFGGGGGGQFKQRFSIDVDERLLRQEKWASAGVDVALRGNLSARVEGAGHVYTFEPSRRSGPSVKRSLDRNELTATAQLRYALTSETSVVASLDAIEDRFLGATGDATRTARSYRYLAGFEFGTRAVLTGKVLAGVREFPRGQGAPSYRGLALAVSATLPVRRLGRLGGFAERDVSYAVSSASAGEAFVRNSFISTSLRGELGLELPFALLGRASLGVQEAKYLPPHAGTGRRVEHLWTASASLLRRFGDSVRVGGTIAWSRRVSNRSGASYAGLRYGVQAEVVP